MDRSLVYVADPMCSWCYGFAPELAAFLDAQELPVRLVMGGLWPGARAQPLEPELEQYLRDTWTRVASMSGQPFSYELLDSNGWVYDTELACRAVVTMRTMVPGQEMPFFESLQHAFYAQATDLTDEFAYPALIGGYPVDVADFMLMFRSAEIAEATRADFAEAQALGVFGFPTLLLWSGETHTPLARGYARAPQVARTFEVLGGS